MMAPEIFYGIGAVAILAALAYAMFRNRHRNRRNDVLTDIATREQYQHPETYDQTERALKAQAARNDDAEAEARRRAG